MRRRAEIQRALGGQGRTWTGHGARRGGTPPSRITCKPDPRALMASFRAAFFLLRRVGCAILLQTVKTWLPPLRWVLTRPAHSKTAIPLALVRATQRSEDQDDVRERRGDSAQVADGRQRGERQSISRPVGARLTPRGSPIPPPSRVAQPDQSSQDDRDRRVRRHASGG